MIFLNLFSQIYPLGLPIALSLTGYNSFLTGLIVLIKRRDRPGLSYFACSFVMFLWGIGLAFMLHNELPSETAQWWGTLSQIAALFIPVTWLHFVLVYTNNESKFKKLLLAIYGITFFIFPFSWTSNYVAGFRAVVQVNRYPMPGPLYVVFTFLFAGVVAFSFWVFWSAIRKASSAERCKDYCWVAGASLYGFLTGSPSFFPVYGIPLPQYNLLLIPLWQILLAYAVIRHEAFDIGKIAQAAHRDKLAAIGTIATSINHEIRNPLYIIHGMAESFLHNFRDEEKNLQIVKTESVAVLEKTAHQAKRAMDIMSQLSMFAKQKSGEVAVRAENANLRECLNNVLPLVRHEMTLDKISFKSDLPDDLPSIKANPRQIEEVLFNLLVNACQALKAEGGRIKICACVIGEKVTVKIEDDGSGIPQPQLKKIFEPFYTTKDEGTGLGLYIVRQLVEKNGGKISVESQLGSGTRFILEFSR